MHKSARVDAVSRCISRMQISSFVSAMRLLFASVLLLCVIGTALAVVERDSKLGSRREGDIIESLLREKRNTAKNACGVRGPSYQTLIAGGTDANVGEFPWHVGVYRTVVNEPNVQDCGGTLISETLVLSAAHCFWHESLRKLKPHTIYKIAAGKHLRDWNLRQPETQIRDVAEINVPRRYRGRNSNYQYDIAVVRMASGVEFNALVMPVCMDWTKQFEAVHMTVGVSGTAVGWGVTLDDVAAEVLQTVDLPFVDFDTCFDALPENAKKLYTDDKFCAGFANKSRSVCQGDSGGGLTFEAGDRYYLRGVVSVSFKPESNRDPCYSQLYTGFTLVSQYLPWIKTFVDNEQPGPRTVTQKPPKKSKSQEMCELYSTAVYDSVELPSSAPIKVSTCAMSPSGITSQRLISQPREFPHMVALGYVQGTIKEIQYLCNGNLISEQFVLTAAHCITMQNKRLTLQYVRLGSVTLKESNTEQGLKILGVELTFVHPQYANKTKFEAYNDLALVKLNESVSFNGYMRPACLDSNPSLLDQEKVTVASWGRATADREVYDNLLHGIVSIVDGDECQQKYDINRYQSTVIPNGIVPADMLCFNPLDSSTDCSLTSGSPMMMKLTDPFCMYRIVGLVTFGVREQCTGMGPPFPSVGMRISAYISWIESIVWPTTPDDANVDVEVLTPSRRARPTLGPLQFPS